MLVHASMEQNRNTRFNTYTMTKYESAKPFKLYRLLS